MLIILLFASVAWCCTNHFYCPAGKKMVQKKDPNKEKDLYKCGSYNVNIPKKYSFFHTCCVDHDVCYNTCGTYRTTCDSTFYNCMKRKCDAKYRKFYQKLSKGACRTVAYTFYQAVKRLGCTAFRKGWEKYCECRSNDDDIRMSNLWDEDIWEEMEDDDLWEEDFDEDLEVEDLNFDEDDFLDEDDEFELEL